MDVKPKAFCGSSSESLRVVHEIRSQLDDTATVVSWKGLIKLGDYALERLLSLVTTFDFGIFVFAADDMVESRGQRLLVARDNVVLELGLFMERLGRKRTFLVAQDVSPKLHLPSDLQGLTIARFSLPPEFSPPSEKKLSKVPPAMLADALTPACDELRNAILDEIEPTKPPDALSGGMVYLLRYLDVRAYSVNELVPALVYFETKEKFDKLSDYEKRGWRKATQYACQCLRTLALADSYDGGEFFRITEKGRKMLNSEGLKERFDSELGMKKVRLLPARR